MISVVGFKPKAGMETELLDALADRVALLRRLGLATDRPTITARARGGVIVEISEWVDQDAIGRAHETPEVTALWTRFDACSEYVKLGSLEECDELFATFETIR